MNKRVIHNTKDLLPGPKRIRIIRQIPLSIPGGCVPIRLLFIKRTLTVLCPVNKLNNVPKGLPFDVQGDMCMGNNFEDSDGLITPEGTTYVWRTSIG